MRPPRGAGQSVSIIGPGNWGSSLARSLSDAGVQLDEIVVPGSSQRKRSAAFRSLYVTLDRARLTARVLWLCVPDSSISRVALGLVQRTAARGLQGQIVVHSSGALSSEILLPASVAGASVASVHPLMSFPTRTPVSLQGVPFGVEADARSRRVLNSILRRIGGRPFPIKTDSKALYHVVGMLASPLMVSHLAGAQQVAALAGFTPRQARALVEPILRATLDNVFLRGPIHSFSGPIARGDVQTIRLHLKALQSHPMLASVYRSLALYALEVLPGVSKPALRRVLR